MNLNMQKTQRWWNRWPFILTVLAFAILLLGWDLLARFSGWSAQVFPGPIPVFISLGELATNGTLLKHTVASLFRITVGF